MCFCHPDAAVPSVYERYLCTWCLILLSMILITILFFFFLISSWFIKGCCCKGILVPYHNSSTRTWRNASHLLLKITNAMLFQEFGIAIHDNSLQLITHLPSPMCHTCEINPVFSIFYFSNGLYNMVVNHLYFLSTTNPFMSKKIWFAIIWKAGYFRYILSSSWNPNCEDIYILKCIFTEMPW